MVNLFGGQKDRYCSVVRYVNVMGSRVSIIKFFMTTSDKGVLPISDAHMIRFVNILVEEVDLVRHAFEDIVGGEIYVKQSPHEYN